jgi:hypothetical protein
MVVVVGRQAAALPPWQRLAVMIGNARLYVNGL